MRLICEIEGRGAKVSFAVVSSSSDFRGNVGNREIPVKCRILHTRRIRLSRAHTLRIDAVVVPPSCSATKASSDSFLGLVDNPDRQQVRQQLHEDIGLKLKLSRAKLDVRLINIFL